MGRILEDKIMINFTPLIIQYKQNKNKLLLDKIYAELKSTVQQKAKFIFFAKWYPMNLYHKCKYCRNCDKLNNVPKSEHNLICKECDICKCVKGYFNLKKDNLCEYEDVENDIWLEILRTVENFDTTKDFNTYVFSCLWEFVPSFITKDFIKSLSHKSLTQQDEEGNETEMDIPDEPEESSSLNLDQLYKMCRTKTERKVIDLLLKGHKQIHIANELNVSEPYISQIIAQLKRKCLKLIKNENKNLL
jgi:RNA polymerase sigma factor (sigma-70 family)